MKERWTVLGSNPIRATPALGVLRGCLESLIQAKAQKCEMPPANYEDIVHRIDEYFQSDNDKMLHNGKGVAADGSNYCNKENIFVDKRCQLTSTIMGIVNRHQR